jgi:DNA polymerase-1
MDGKVKLLLIDGNNTAHRVHYTHRHLARDGVCVSLLYGFFRTLVSLKRKYPGHLPVIAWDGGYARRLAESKVAVEEGIIPSHYKANRPRYDDPHVDIPPDVLNVHEQMPPLREALKFARCMQIQADGIEADDIICTYTKMNATGHNVIITSDHDYYQLINEYTEIYDSMKSTYWTRQSFVDSYGFDPILWVDVGALMGDSGDEIHGVPGIGEVNATKLVKEYGCIDNVLAGLKAKEKRGKKEQAVLDYEKRLKLAYSLKRMDIISDMPSPKAAPKRQEPLAQWFKQFKFDSLMNDVHWLI